MNYFHRIKPFPTESSFRNFRHHPCNSDGFPTRVMMFYSHCLLVPNLSSYTFLTTPHRLSRATICSSFSHVTNPSNASSNDWTCNHSKWQIIIRFLRRYKRAHNTIWIHPLPLRCVQQIIPSRVKFLQIQSDIPLGTLRRTDRVFIHVPQGPFNHR